MIILPLRNVTGWQTWTLVAVCAVLASCGGGGGGASSSPAAANQPPVASAKLLGEAVLQATTVFDSSASSDPDGSVASRRWDYGDGQIGSADSHIYTATGNYTASLTVTDNAGSSTSTSVAVKVAKCSAEGTVAAGLSPFTTLCVQTSLGEMVVEVFENLAPVTAANFLRYADEGFYSGLIFHRVFHTGIDVIQAGAYLPGPAYKAPTHANIVLENQNGLKHAEYTLAMARATLPDTANSQFFINLVTNTALNYNAAVSGPNGYAVFGKVLTQGGGTAVVDAIGAVATHTVASVANAAAPSQTISDVPAQDIVIRSVVRMR